MIADLKPYPKLKDSRVQWLGEVPGHWEVSKIKSLARPGYKTFVDGDWIESPYITPDGIRLIQTGNIGTGEYREKGFRYISEETFKNFCCTEVEPDDILICRLGEPVARTCLAPRIGKRMITSVDVCILKPRAEANAKFFVYSMSSRRYLDWVGSLVRGSTRDRVSRSMLGSFAVPVPPLPEQFAIVRFLDHADRRIRRYIRAKQKLIALLEEQKQAIIHQAVTGQIDVRTGQSYSAYKDSGMEWLGKVPVHWGVMRLGRLITLTTGFPFKSEGFTQSEEDFRLLRGVNIAPGRLRWEEIVRWPVADAENFTEYQLELGDIVLGMDRPIIQDGIRVAEVGQSDLPSLLLQRVARIRPSEELDGDFALLLLNDKNFYNYLAPIFTGISVPHLSPEQLRAFRFTLPPIFEQTAIVRFLDHAATKIATAITRARREIDLLHEYRTRLIADVVTGKLDVRKAVACLPDETETSQAMDRPEAHLLSTRT